jgi:hypothetical protein
MKYIGKKVYCKLVENVMKTCFGCCDVIEILARFSVGATCCSRLSSGLNHQQCGASKIQGKQPMTLLTIVRPINSQHKNALECLFEAFTFTQFVSIVP